MAAVTYKNATRSHKFWANASEWAIEPYKRWYGQSAYLKEEALLSRECDFSD